MLPRHRFDEVVNSLEKFYRVEMDDFSREAFYDYANSTFTIIAKFDRAVKLVMTNEPNFGRFPSFDKFGTAFAGYMKTQSGAYETATVHLLPVAETKDEVIDRRCLEVTKSDIERLKAKVYVCKFFKSHKSIEWANRYLAEAIEEANSRNISLETIGIPSSNTQPSLSVV